MLIWSQYLTNNDNHNHNRVININFLNAISRHQKKLMRINTMMGKGTIRITSSRNCMDITKWGEVVCASLGENGKLHQTK